MFEAFRKKSQRGAIIIMTAFLLPVTIAMAGLAIDAGNLYYHKSVLQNAADAAAVAGAKIGAEDIKKPEELDTKFKKELADQKAIQLTQDNTEQFQLISSEKTVEKILNDESGTMRLRYLKSVSEPKNTRYYAVRLQEEVPLYFAKYFIDGGKQTVTAKSIAKIHMGNPKPENLPEEDDGAWFHDLFIFEKKLEAVNTIENPDNFNIKNPGQSTIKSTFDGRIRCTDENKKPELYYSTQTNKLDRFFTKKAQEEQISVNEAIAKKAASYNDKGKDTTEGGGYWSQEYYAQYDIRDYWDNHIYPMVESQVNAMKKKHDDLIRDNKQEEAKAVSPAAKQTEQTLATGSPVIYDLSYKPDQNVTIELNNKIAGDPSEPAYVVIKAGTGQWGMGLGVVNIDVNADTNQGRPLIVCVEPSERNAGAAININLHGHKFRGLIYEPVSASSRGVLINSNVGGNDYAEFYGTIITRSLYLGQNCHYIYDGIKEGGVPSKPSQPEPAKPAEMQTNLSDDTEDVAGFDSL